MPGHAEQLGVVEGGFGPGAHGRVDPSGVLADEDPPRAGPDPSRMTAAAPAADSGARAQ